MEQSNQNWFSSVEAPIEVSSRDAVTWDESKDLVVVGFGGAGVATALQTLDNGFSVIAFDKFAGGGATTINGAVVYAGAGTSVQKEAEIADTADNMFNYLKQEAVDIVSDETLRDFCNTSPEMIDWLQQKGVKFGTTVWHKKTSYPGPEYFVYHSDNSLATTYKKNAAPAARGHRGYVPIKEGRKATNLGYSIFNPLKQSALDKGLLLETYHEVRQLVVDDKQEVLGVMVLYFDDEKLLRKYQKLKKRAERLLMVLPPILPGYNFFAKRAMAVLEKAKALEAQRSQKMIEAKKGVMLSAGGFIYNADMVNHYAPKYKASLPLGTEGDDGSGIRLGQSVGAKADNMDCISAWRFINPPLSFGRGFIVNKHGKRFIDELVYGATLGVEMVENHEGKAWLILDKKLVKAALEEVSGGKALNFQRDLARLNVWFAAVKSPTIEGLAKKLSLPADALKVQLETYNQAARAQNGSDAFEKSDDDLVEISRPFYGIDISLDAKLFPCPALTLGGLKINESTGQVLDNDGKVVKGLYASGRNAIGVSSKNYVSGLSVADCIFSGRRAAQHISGN